MAADDFMKGHFCTLNGIRDAGAMRAIKYAAGWTGAAKENIRRAVAALERRGRRRRREGAERLALLLRRWELAGYPKAGKAARELEEAPGGPRVMRVVRRARK